MAITNESEKLRREANRLLARVEQQGVALVARYQSGRAFSARYQDFRRFIEQVDQFQVFVDLVEERLPQFEDSKRAALEKHLAQLRWRVVIIEVDATQVFVVRIVESGKPWPLGSRQFLERRLNRLTEIAEYFDRCGERFELPPLAETLVDAVSGLLKAEIARTPALEDFGIHHEAFIPPRLRIEGRARISRRAAAPAGLPVRAAPARRFRVREMAGRFYAERGSIVAVSEACRAVNMSLDELAQQLGLSRPALVLILNGTDPMQRNQLDQLRSFIGNLGGDVAVETGDLPVAY